MKRSTIFGILAILIWATNVAFSRSLTESLGTLTAGATSFILGGTIAILYVWFSSGSLKSLVHQSPRYLFICGVLFVINDTSLNCAIGFASSRPQVLAVGLINYLWPTFGLLFSIPILKKKARFYLPLGVLVAMAGVCLALTNGDLALLGDIVKSHGAGLAFLLAFVAAVTWGLYSNLSSKWGGDSDQGAVPLFILSGGLLMLALRAFTPEATHWSAAAGLNLIYMAIFPAMLAFLFWDNAMRKGQTITVMALSYLIPLLSTVISVITLGISPSPSLWLAAALVIGGAIVCRSAIY